MPATAQERPIEGFGSFLDCLLRTRKLFKLVSDWSMLRVAMMRNFLSDQSLWKFLWTEIAALLGAPLGAQLPPGFPTNNFFVPRSTRYPRIGP